MSTTTTTVTVQPRMRSFSLSLISRQSRLIDLPLELLFEIIHFALLESKASALSTIAKHITKTVNTILYRAVILDNIHRASLFLRTAKSNHSLLQHIRHFSVTAPDLTHQCWADIRSVLPHSKGLLSLALHNGEDLSAFASATSEGELSALSSITIRQYSDLPVIALVHDEHTPSPITHLRICEPSPVWHSPATIMSSFGCPQVLSHVQLSRRVRGNADNDEIFVSEVKEILQDYPELKTVVVSLFPPGWSAHTEDFVIEQTRIGSMLQGIDARLSVVKGKFDCWIAPPWEAIF